MGVFRVIIAGSRKFNDYKLLKSKMDIILKNVKDEIHIICGEAPGADSLGKKYCNEKGYILDSFPADWDNIEGLLPHQIGINKFGKKFSKIAGPIRNELMSQNADALVLFWDGVSTGSADMLERAKNKNLKIRIIRYK